ncbi:MAG: hypothetical protein ABIV48_06435 [Pyrinomonadaceae bacterium]
MATPDKVLGKLVTDYGIAPAYLQRAVFVAVLAFLFFIAMMFAFYIRQGVGYFMLASAFLVLYLLTLFSWFMQRKTIVKIYENGISYKYRSARWNEIESVDDGILNIRDEKPITIPRTINDQAGLFDLIRSKVG